MNIQAFKISGGHGIIRYVDDAGERKEFDLTAHMDERANAAVERALTAVDENLRKKFGINL